MSPNSDITAKHPVIWAISAWRAGDHAQLVALAAALKRAYGWEVEFKPVCDRRTDPAGFGYKAPWPDAVIGIGRGGTRLGMWLKRQSGGQSKFIQLGRSEGKMRDCDLIVTTAQYGFPDAPNLIRLTLPLTQQGRPDDPAIAAWTPELARNQRPLIGVLVGGPSDPLLLGVAEGRRLVTDLAALAATTGGSLLIATGRRTPTEVVAMLEELVATAPDRHRLIAFPATGFAKPEDNPYRAILALADRFVVTADSVSMLADACATGKPVTMFDLPVIAEKIDFVEYWRWRRRRRFALGKGRDPIDCLYDAGIRHGWIKPGRDVPTLLTWLKRGGGVAGDPAQATQMAARLRDERQLVLDRLHRLLTPTVS
ncbi:MAG TPA: ELM1/GtrOC1 family putative glycosyltransferase [Dongiaceae bacterium]